MADFNFNTVEEAIAALKKGDFVIVLDAQSRENEGDLILAAEFANPEKIAFMLEHTSGILCVPLTKKRLQQLALPRMVSQNTDRFQTPFTVSVDAKSGITSGVSAEDRAVTIRSLIDAKACPEDISRPGHVFPLEASVGGVLERPGHTEAAVDLCTLAGLYPGAVIAEVMEKPGVVAKGDALFSFAREHGIVLIPLEALIAYRKKHSPFLQRESVVQLPMPYGMFDLYSYTEKGYYSSTDSMNSDKVHFALVRGFVENSQKVLVRVHSECFTGDVFHSQRCDCGEQLHKALSQIAKADSGILIYLRQEGRGIGLLEKLKSYNLQERGYDTVEANTLLGFPPDPREYTLAAQILSDLGVQSVTLLTNNPSKVERLKASGVSVIDRISLPSSVQEYNAEYLKTKKEKFGHFLEL